MGREIPSDAVHHGRNFDVGPWKDDRYVRCGRCGFICHLDRDRRSKRGSKEGWGITYSAIASYDESTVEYDQSDMGYDGYYLVRETHTGGCPFCGSLLYYE
jgi:hypothetical protein